MKFSNKKSISSFKMGYLIILLIAFLIVFYNVLIEKSGIFSLKQLALGLPLVLLFVWYRKAKYFEYDSDGLGLVFINRGAFVTEYVNYREDRVEIPKEKLSNYKIRKYLVFNILDVYIKSKNNVRRQRFNISLVSNKKIEAMNTSLKKIVSENSSK